MSRSNTPDTKLFEIAQLRYGPEKLNNTEIANRYNVSGTHVARWLQEAEDRGLIKFELSPPLNLELQAGLRQRFPGLREAIVVTTSSDGRFQRQLLGKATARFFEDYIDGAQTASIGLGSGSTVQALIDALPQRRRDIKIYPTRLRGLGPTIPERPDALVHITQLWEKSGRVRGAAHYATIPRYEAPELSEAFKKSMLDRKTVGKVYNEMCKVDAIFSSIDGLSFGNREDSSSTLFSELRALDIKEKQLKQWKAAGEISYSFFDTDGHPVVDLDKHFLTLGAELLRRVAADNKKRVVVIAGGTEKLEPLKAALKGRLLNVLVTDEENAKSLIAP